MNAIAFGPASFNLRKHLRNGEIHKSALARQSINSQRYQSISQMTPGPNCEALKSPTEACGIAAHTFSPRYSPIEVGSAPLPLPGIQADALAPQPRSGDKSETINLNKSIGSMRVGMPRCGKVSLYDSKPNGAGAHTETLKFVQTLKSLACFAVYLVEIAPNNFCLIMNSQFWLVPSTANKNFVQYF